MADSQCGTSAGLYKCVMICIHRCSIRQTVFTTLRVLCALSTLLSPDPGNHSSLHCLYSLTFCRTSYSWSHTASSLFTLASHRDMPLRFLHVFLGCDSSFLLLLGNLYAQCRARPHDPEMKSHTPHCLSHPGAPTAHFFLVPKDIPLSRCTTVVIYLFTYQRTFLVAS